MAFPYGLSAPPQTMSSSPVHTQADALGGEAGPRHVKGQQPASAASG
jgi:hypothetical protein